MIAFSYDTFEMLRENLDTVLKELLEFKSHEQVTSLYPGPHLDVEDNYLDPVTLSSDTTIYPYNKYVLDILDNYSKDIRNSGSDGYHYNIDSNVDKKEIINRIRRYVNEKSRENFKPIQKINKKFYKQIIQNRKNINLSKKSNHKDTGKSMKVTTAKRKFMIKSKEIRHGRKLHMYTKKIMKRRQREIAITKEILMPHIYEDPAHGDAALKARYLFKSCMNYEILDKRGHQPLLDLLHLLGGWPILDPKWNESNFNWLELMANLRLYNNDILISEWVGPDIKNSDEFVIQFDQTSLGNFFVTLSIGFQNV